MKAIRFKLISLLACLLIATSLSIRPSEAQSTLVISTRLEIRPQHIVSAYRPSFSGAEEKPPVKLVKEPEYNSKKPRYGRVTVGNAKEKKDIVVAIDEAEGEAPRVYIDSNNNRDLTDDGDAQWTRLRDGVYQKTVAIRATFEEGGEAREVELPYGVYRFSDEERKKRGVFYYRKYGRTGTLEIAGKQYRVALSTLDNQGIYSDREKILLAIDLNRDDNLDLSMGSAEMFKGAEPFNIDGESYRIARVTDMGDRVSLEVSSEKVEARRYISRGEPAVEFDFQTLDGKKMRLSDFRGKVVMLDFWATWCGPCIKDLPDLKRLYAAFDRSKFEIIGISLDGKSTRTPRDRVVSFIQKNEMTWPNTFDDGGWGNAVAKLYRVTGIPHQLIIDQKGVIRLITGGADASGSKLERIHKAIEELLEK